MVGLFLCYCFCDNYGMWVTTKSVINDFSVGWWIELGHIKWHFDCLISKYEHKNYTSIFRMTFLFLFALNRFDAIAHTYTHLHHPKIKIICRVSNVWHIRRASIHFENNSFSIEPKKNESENVWTSTHNVS